MGLEAMSASDGAPVASDKDRNLSKVELDMPDVSREETLALGQEKKPRKKWTKEETQMLVNGCNKVDSTINSSNN